MKNIIKIVVFTLVFSCSSSSEDTPDTTAPQKLTLSYSVSDVILTLKWNKPKDSDAKEVIIEKSENSTEYVELTKITSMSDTVEDYATLTPNIPLYFRVKVADNAGNNSEYSNIISITLINITSNTNTAWTALTGSSPNFSQVISDMTVIINNTGYSSAQKAEAYIARGWSYLKRANGQSTNADVTNSINDFLLSNSKNDSKSGLSILYLLKEDYNNTIIYTEQIRGLSSYQHSHFSHINKRYVLIQGAYAYWYLQNASKVKTYLDVINNVSNSPSDLDAQLPILQSLSSEIDAPKAW